MAQVINLGDVVRDRISGFEGVVIGRTKWLRNCDRLIVQPQKLHEGKPIDGQSFDEPDLEFVRHSDVCECVRGTPASKTGGPRPTPTRR